jgi:hypothetical protein
MGTRPFSSPCSVHGAKTPSYSNIFGFRHTASPRTNSVVRLPHIHHGHRPRSHSTMGAFRLPLVTDFVDDAKCVVSIPTLFFSFLQWVLLRSPVFIPSLEHPQGSTCFSSEQASRFFHTYTQGLSIIKPIQLHR